jgi:hypothetical protein
MEQVGSLVVMSDDYDSIFENHLENVTHQGGEFLSGYLSLLHVVQSLRMQVIELSNAMDGRERARLVKNEKQRLERAMLKSMETDKRKERIRLRHNVKCRAGRLIRKTKKLAADVSQLQLTGENSCDVPDLLEDVLKELDPAMINDIFNKL